ncbi:MAG: GNAT family N-acetyltransferase [Theionarchaea archaeon]|nr:GNAT family N-acetyltransferase [Theionarchaea archaeon]
MYPTYVGRLQGYLCEKHKDYEWYLTDTFYESLEKNFKDKAELLMFFKDDIPLASILALNLPDVAHYRFAGADPHYKQYQGYFLIYYQGIKRALEKKQKKIYFGLTTYDFKEKIGCKRKPLFELVKMENPLLNTALRLYAAFSKIVNIDLLK